MKIRYSLGVLIALKIGVPATLPAQTSSAMNARMLWSLDAERGGPTAKPGMLAVSADGRVAFTRASDDREHLVTLLDSTSRAVARLGRQGDGPGEFRSVFKFFFAGDLMYAFDVGKISAFDRTGRHRFSRALPPFANAIAVTGDSVDFMDISGLRRPGFLGEIRRKSLALNGGDRVLFGATDPTYRALATHPTDSGRYVRVAYGIHRGAPVMANSFTYKVQQFTSAGRAGAQIGATAPLLQLRGAALEKEIETRLAESRRPFNLPDGTTRPMPDRSAEIRAAAAAPREYFSARLGGMHVDAATGDVWLVETALPTTRIVRLSGGKRSEVEIPCDARGANSAIATPFLAIVCAKGRGSEVELRLYRLH